MKKIFVAMFVAMFLMAAFAVSAVAQSNKIDVCHRTDSGYNKISVGGNAFQGHMGHGDVVPGQTVATNQLQEYDNNCVVVASKPDFEEFYIRNNNTVPLAQRISAPWDPDMNITENAAGDGFSAITPNTNGGQKVGYGTSFWDGLPLNKLQSVNFVKLSGAPNPPYLNIWVTDGAGRYAIISSENSYMGTNFATRQEWKVFETNFADLNWLCASGTGARDGSQYLTCGGVRVTMADIANSVLISSPSDYSSSFIGTGPPRAGYGVNVIYGDTASNFVGAYHLNMLSFLYDGINYFAAN